MSLLDRLRRPNTIEATETQEQDLQAAKSAPSAGGNPAQDDSQQAALPPAFDKYYVETKGGKTDYFEDYQKKSHAMSATDNSISSRKQDIQTVREMVQFAEAKGWTTLKVSGTPEFKREAWIEAQARGLKAEGYKPNQLDHQEAAKRAKDQGLDPAKNTVENAHPKPEPAPAAAPEAASAKAGPEKGESQRQQQPANDRAEPPMTPEAKARAERVDEYLRGKEAFVLGKAPHPPKDKGMEAGLERAEAKLAATGKPFDRFDVAKAFREQDRHDFAKSADKIAIRDGMSAAEHRAVIRAARNELSEDGKLVLQAVSAKISQEMTKLNTEARTKLTAEFARDLAMKERAEGAVSLSPDQRAQANVKATPEQELAGARAHMSQLQERIASSASQVGKGVIDAYDQAAVRVAKLSEQAKGKEAGKAAAEPAKATAKDKPKQAPAPKQESAKPKQTPAPKPATAAKAPEQPRRVRSR